MTLYRNDNNLIPLPSGKFLPCLQVELSLQISKIDLYAIITVDEPIPIRPAENGQMSIGYYLNGSGPATILQQGPSPKKFTHRDII